VADDPALKISLASWSMHRMFFEEGLDLLGMVDLTAEYGIKGFEFVNTFFPSPQFRYLERLRSRCADHGITPLLIMCDGEGNLAATDAAERAQAVKNHHKWIDIAQVLGCHSIRINVHGDISDPDAMRDRAAEALSALCDYGDRAGVDVIIENHGNRDVGNETPAADPRWIVSLVEATAHPRLGTLPDFGNWAPQPLRGRGATHALRARRLREVLHLRRGRRRERDRLRAHDRNRARRGLHRLRRHRVRGVPRHAASSIASSLPRVTYRSPSGRASQPRSPSSPGCSADAGGREPSGRDCRRRLDR
jgi:sugar phosphate isomerase/epimerase